MTSGNVGGQVGNAVGSFYEGKYGKKKAKFIEASVGFIATVFFLFVYLFVYKPISIINLKEKPFYTKSYEQIGSNGKGTIVIKSIDGSDAKINSDLWKNKSSAFAILTELKMKNELSLWVKKFDESKVFGLKIGNIIIEPEHAIIGHNKNREWLLYLTIFFFIISVAELIRAISLKQVKS